MWACCTLNHTWCVERHAADVVRKFREVVPDQVLFLASDLVANLRCRSQNNPRFSTKRDVNSLNLARVRIPVPQKLKYIFVHETRMKSFLSLQKFQEDDTQVWATNCQQKNEPLFSRKIHSGVRNRLSPASVECVGLRRIRAHRVKIIKLNAVV
ncbi:hypothetical protein AVEN_160611-1 [Araneus ventricosus]|uniref:Uncharacterized protein n=1 Tax=Araneus ventricosus TaxID=182803 RepID=A0A4Y2I5P5_ARAVE|nr:hypothetical protein AVEN_19913-1 [Araneus ventricosus]GBM73035.1 hypothetical protein AVEN_160611-1 [Araneus ventricosus]